MASSLITTINEEHRTIAKLLHLIDRQVMLFAESDTPDLDLLRSIMEYTQSFPDLYHHPKEDAIFVKLKEREPAMGEQVDTLLEDHRNMHLISSKFANLVEQLIGDATMPREVFIKAAMNYVDFQRNHMMREVGDVLPAAMRVLSAAAWAELEANAELGDDPLKAGKEHFQRLSALLLSEV